MLELFGSARCPYSAELREELLYDGSEFVEYDVEADATALRRLGELTGGTYGVPVLVRDGRVERIGWQGRTCFINPR